MASAAPPLRRNINPSYSHPDTLYAAEEEPSDLETSHILPSNDSHHQHEPILPRPTEPDPNPRVPSLTLRDRGFSSASSASSSSVRRKPLPPTISPLATRFSSGEYLATTFESPEQTFVRSYSVDSPGPFDLPLKTTIPSSPARFPRQKERSLPSKKSVALTSDHTSSERPTPPPKTHIPQTPNLPVLKRQARASLERHARFLSDSTITIASESTAPWCSDSSSTSVPPSATMSIFSTKPTPPHNIKIPNTVLRSYSNESYSSDITNKPLPKSPGASKLGSFFGWGSTSPVSSTTTLSEKGYSPTRSSPSPELPIPSSDASKPSTRNIPTAIDVPKANADAGYIGDAYLQLPLATPTTPQVEEMEKELKDISAELASSIRREMDLEDLVDRLQAEANVANTGRRTSDYFSDSGTSSLKYGDTDSKQDELDRLMRKTEQEKAQIRLELTNKVQEERARRKQLDLHIRALEEKASHVDLASINSLDTNGRLKSLEATCEDLRRRLADERQVKDNFEDLLTALKGELQSSHNERDNLRDEIVPQLRARVEGLEAQAAQHEKLTYEQSKMQQELQSLKTENNTLINAQKQVDMHQMKRFNTIAEEAGATNMRSAAGLTRSSSLAQGINSRSRAPSLTRSTSVKTTESREALAERVKDIELQRDSLHQALKSLLERQEHQSRENRKKIRQLEAERDCALSNSPKRLGYDKEVANLREEINILRRRAEEAIEQKWQCEKGLSGLKMDLDRAKQEIGSLRSLLQGNDILVPSDRCQSSAPRPGSSHVTSESLERAYRSLQQEYAASLERIKNLEISGPKDDDTEKAISQLEKSLADAISERDYAKNEVESLRDQSDSLRRSEQTHMGDELVLADNLRGSAKRVEELAAQVRQQLASNSTLRQRLADSIERGEKEQRTNAEKIMFMQTKLKNLEDQLMTAQQSSEEALSRHEDEVRDIKENHNIQLQRLKSGARSPRLFGPKSPVSPMFASSAKVPNILSTSSGKAMTVSEESKMDYLKQRVIELETALADADKEMEEVVGRMNIAQMEVMQLQNEREEAVRETKRLQKMIEQERVRAFQGKSATRSP